MAWCRRHLDQWLYCPLSLRPTRTKVWMKFESKYFFHLMKCIWKMSAKWRIFWSTSRYDNTVDVLLCFWKFSCYESCSIRQHQICTVPANTLRNNDVVITSKRRHFDVITSKWRRFGVIATLLLRQAFVGWWREAEYPCRWRFGNYNSLRLRPRTGLTAF